MPPDDAILLYDGTCGFCSRTVQFVLRHERRHTLRFATLDGALAERVRREHPWLADIDSVILYTPPAPGRPSAALVRSAAGLAVFTYVGGVWGALATAARIVPRPVRDAVYDLIARYRRRIAPMTDSCLLPTPEQRRRFV